MQVNRISERRKFNMICTLHYLLIILTITKISVIIYFVQIYNSQSCELPIKEWIHEYILVEFMSWLIDIYRIRELKIIFNHRTNERRIIVNSRGTFFYENEIDSMRDSNFWYNIDNSEHYL